MEGVLTMNQNGLFDCETDRVSEIKSSAHDRNTKLNLANAYQIKNEAID